MTTAAYPSPGAGPMQGPNSSMLSELQEIPLDSHSVQGQLARLGGNLDNLSKIVSMLNEATSAYHRLPSEPHGRAMQPSVDGTSQRHDLLNSLNESLESEIDRLNALYGRLDL